MTGGRCHRLKKMMGRGPDGGCGADERPCRPVSRFPTANSLANETEIPQPTVKKPTSLEVDFFSQANKVLSVHSPFDVADNASGSGVPSFPILSTLPSRLASLLRQSDGSRKKHKRSHSGVDKKSSSRVSDRSKGGNIWVETEEYFRVHTLAQSPNLAGVKECVGNDRVEQYTDKGIVVWSGNDDQCHDARWNHGATGVISVTSNLLPGLMRKLMFEGKNTELNSKLLPLIDWLFQEPNPIALNTALAQLGVVRPVFRLPYVPLPLAKRIEFVNLVKKIGRENFVGEKNVQVLDDDDFILISRY